jgi:hypothetical protein
MESNLTWEEIAQKYYDGDRKGFIRHARQFLQSDGGIRPESYTMLAEALSKDGKQNEAIDILEAGVRRFPEEPICHYFLGLELARASQSNPKRRALAITHLRNAAQYTEVWKGDFRHAEQEAQALTKLPIDARYPPVSPAVSSVLRDLMECGFFPELTLDQVLDLVGRDLGEEFLKSPTRDKVKIVEIVGCDVSKSIVLDEGFNLDDLTRRIGRMFRNIGQELVVSGKGQEKRTFSVGNRSVELNCSKTFEVAKKLNHLVSSTEWSFYEILYGRREPDQVTISFLSRTQREKLTDMSSELSSFQVRR